MVEPGQESSRPSTHASAHRKEIHRLKQLLAEKTWRWIFFRGACKNRGRRQRSSGSGEMASRPDPRGDVIARQLSNRAHVSDVPVSRRGFYRSLKEQQPAEEEMEVPICDPTNCLGASSPLRLSTNYGGAAPPGNASEHKRVARIMREITCWDAAEAVRGHHQFESQAGDISQLSGPYELTGIPSALVADITYIRLKAELSI